MAIYRIHKEDNYVIVDKAFLLNEKISEISGFSADDPTVTEAKN